MAERVNQQAGMSTADGTSSGTWLGAAAVMGLVFVVGTLPFIAAVTHGYSRFDDIPMLDTTAFHGLSWEHLSWMFTTVHMGHYQPLSWLTFAIEWTLFGMQAGVSHAVNVIVHGVNAVLVFVLGSKLIGLARPELSAGLRRWGAVAAAMLFGAHPLRVESVAWVTERRDVLSLLFYLLALIWYLGANESGIDAKERRGRMLGVWVFFVLSLLAKAWGMTFFLVLVILDWYPLRRITVSAVMSPAALRVWFEKIPFAVVGVGWAVVAAMAASSFSGTSKTLAEWGVVDRLCQATYGLMFYIWKTVWPVDLAVLYELPREMRPWEPRVMVAGAVVVAIAVVCLVKRRKWPALAAAMLAYTVIVSPVLGLFQSGIQLVADRYSYLSMIGPMIALGGVFAAWMAGRGKRARVIAGAVLGLGVVGLGVQTSRQTSLWRDDEVLFGHAMRTGLDGPVLRIYYGKQLDRVGKSEEAITHFQRAAELDPRNGEAWWAMGNSYRSLKSFEQARGAYAKAIELMRDSWRADQAMGLLLAADMDELEAALPYFRSAVQKIEGSQSWAFQPGPYMTLAQALYDLGDVPGARRELEKALRFRETHDAAAAALKQTGVGR